MAEEIKTEQVKSESAVEKAVKSDSKKTEVKVEKIELQREYIVPLRLKFLKVARYKRAKKAILVLKQFIAKHMKVENRDLTNVRIDRFLNQELWYRGIKKPMNKIKVKATKRDGIVYVELVDIPEVVKFQMEREKKRASKVQKTEIKHDPKNDHKEEGAKDSKTDEAEKDEATQEAGIKENKKQAKQEKHTTKSGHEKTTQPRRQVLQR